MNFLCFDIKLKKTHLVILYIYKIIPICAFQRPCFACQKVSANDLPSPNRLYQKNTPVLKPTESWRFNDFT